MIKITANGVCARAQRLEPLTSGMVGAKVEFVLSPDFDGLTVTAVFTNGAVTKDVLNPGAECFIPPEVLETAGKTVKVGIYAVRGSEIVIPTVYAPIGEVLPGADPSGDTSTSATLPVWAQIEAMIGSLDDLTTEAKNNLVSAINEAAQSGGGGTASIAMRVDGEYIQYSTDNGNTWVNLIAKADLKGDKGADGKDGVDGYTPIKGVDYFDGANGITPHIGDNGNWYISDIDTGKPSRGPVGAPGATGKSAYQYAQESGYTGTETEFAAKLAQKQLIGTTAELTPKQVYDAVSAGIPVKVQYTDRTYGLLSFTAFNIAESLSMIVSQAIVYYGGVYILAELGGNIQAGNWFTKFTTLAEKADIPTAPTKTSQLENDSGYLTLATLPKYGGEVI